MITPCQVTHVLLLALASVEPDACGRADVDDAAPEPESADARLPARGADDEHHARARDRLSLEGCSARTTFVVGALLTPPGASYLVCLSRIDKLNYPPAETVLLVVVFNPIMLALLEVPLPCFADRPGLDGWDDRPIEGVDRATRPSICGEDADGAWRATSDQGPDRAARLTPPKRNHEPPDRPRGSRYELRTKRRQRPSSSPHRARPDDARTDPESDDDPARVSCVGHDPESTPAAASNLARQPVRNEPADVREFPRSPGPHRTGEPEPDSAARERPAVTADVRPDHGHQS